MRVPEIKVWQMNTLSTQSWNSVISTTNCSLTHAKNIMVIVNCNHQGHWLVSLSYLQASEETNSSWMLTCSRACVTGFYQQAMTKQYGWVVSIHASYLEVFKFKSCFRDWLSLLRFSVAFLSLPGECEDSTLKLGHDCFLLNPFQFIIHYHPFIWQNIVLVTEKV
jgi:hypothetical protein